MNISGTFKGSDTAGQGVHVLFVCSGNTCRSPFAQAVFTNIVTRRGMKGFLSDSAGLTALPGDSAPFMAQQVASEYGVDLATHKAKPVSKTLVAWSDLILAMEQTHKDGILSGFPGSIEKVQLIRNFARFGSSQRGITDPYGLQYEAYRFCFLDIEDAVSGLVEDLSIR